MNQLVTEWCELVFVTVTCILGVITLAAYYLTLALLCVVIICLPIAIVAGIIWYVWQGIMLIMVV